MPEIFDDMSVEDVVGDVLVTFFASPNALRWNPSIGPLDKFLMGVLRHKIIDRLRREISFSKHTAGSLDDPGFARKIGTSIAASPPTDQELVRITCADWKKADQDPELHELLIAGLKIDGGRNRNQQLAKEMATSVRDVSNRKKRLRRFLRGE